MNGAPVQQEHCPYLRALLPALAVPFLDIRASESSKSARTRRLKEQQKKWPLNIREDIQGMAEEPQQLPALFTLPTLSRSPQPNDERGQSQV